MPNDSALRSFLAELSPEDITTLVGRLSRLMPQGAAVYSPELNAGEAELVAKRRAERDAARARELEIMEQMLPQMAARRRAAVPEAQADVFVPTRPRVMRESPFMFTQPQSSRAYAGGGPVLGDQTMPDVSDSGQMFMDPMPFAKGGKVGTKTLDEMQAELMSKQGLTRRSLFGLPTQSQQYPLSKVEQEVQRIEQQARKKGEAPAVSTARVDVDPGTGSKRSVMESLVETPMSRRAVLKTAGSQAMQSMLPVGDIAKALDVPVPTGALSQATQAAPVIPVVTEAMIPGLVAEGLQMGLSFPRVMKMVQGELGTGLKNLGEADIERMYYNLFDPYSATNIPGTTRAGDAWRAMTGVEGAFGFPFTQLRQSMRSVRKADPELYETLKKLSRDIAEYGPE